MEMYMKLNTGHLDHPESVFEQTNLDVVFTEVSVEFNENTSSRFWHRALQTPGASHLPCHLAASILLV